MAEKHILHMLTPLRHMSPFDANMALDAGFDAAIPHTDVKLEEVTGLVQDAMFSRPPKLGVKTGIFIGGKQAIMALHMLGTAKRIQKQVGLVRFLSEQEKREASFEKIVRDFSGLKPRSDKERRKTELAARQHAERTRSKLDSEGCPLRLVISNSGARLVPADLTHS